ncbi:MAG: T9SS type A sorting domain-containing protein [Bacteroidota bacterium]
MKNLFLALSLLLSLGSNAQSICFVSADYDSGENFIVFWERPLDFVNYDSVFIYRRLPATEPSFTKIGATHMSLESSYFEDENVTTYITTDYAISFLGTNGVETVLSYYHRPVILDYQAGNLVWTMYEKQFVTGDSWIASYRCMRDQLGLGFYDEMGAWDATGTNGSWFDSQAQGTTDEYTYQMQMDMPVCVVTGRANINTSRSNIKNQFSNAEAGIAENETISFNLAPNPMIDFINVNLDPKFLSSEFMVSDASGKIIHQGVINAEDITLDMSAVSNGTYMFTVKFDGKLNSKFFLKN